MTPSELLFVEDPYVAFCVNEFVWCFGTFIEGELDQVKRKKKEKDERYERRRLSRLRELLADPGEDTFAQSFAEPPGPMVRKA